MKRSNVSPTVSVIIPNHNYGKYLRQTIESVLGQAGVSLDVIVVDNGSTDNSLQVLERFGKNIRVFAQNDQGQAAARNVGLVHAKGTHIAFLDADDYWESTKLVTQLGLMSDSVQLVYSGIRIFDDFTGRTISTIEPTFRGDARFEYLTNPVRSLPPGGESSVVISNALFKKVGYFDERLSSASGRDYFRRCSTLTSFDFTPELFVNYRKHGNNQSKNLEKLQNNTKKAYEILFDDPVWEFSKPYLRSCWTKLHISVIKTYLKRFEIRKALIEVLEYRHHISNREKPLRMQNGKEKLV